MKQIIRLIAAASVLAANAVMARPADAADIASINLAEWTPPDVRMLKDDAFSRLVKYGHALMTDTANQIGPGVSDPARRFSGNNLTCQNCHLKAGAQAYAMPLVGVWGQFPQYRGREGEIGTLEERVNGCMERSMAGRALPLDGREMKAFLAYMKWLSTGIPDGAKLIGAGTLSIKEPARVADPGHGEQVYAQVCAQCHGADGLGRKTAAGSGYEFPPLWGPDSYNDGAGMARLLGAAAFLKHNMPYGTTFTAPVLSDGDAYDVAAYVNNAERPHKANLDKDFPNRMQKPVDTAYGPYVDEFSPAQHKFGPFEPIRARLKELSARQPQR